MIMDPFDELKDNILSATVVHGKSATGFYEVDCPACGGNKKGGFLLDEDEIIYHCFKGKCPVNVTGFSRNGYLSDKFKSLLAQADIEIPLAVIMARSIFVPDEFESSDAFERHSYDTYEFDISVVPLDPNNSEHVPYCDYVNSRKVAYSNFYVNDLGADFKRLIVPFFFNDRLIGYQSIDITGLYHPIKRGNTNMIFLPNGTIPKEPVIVEGIFDAMSIHNGVAILGSTITKKQAYFFRNKNPILLPDRYGSRFMSNAKSYGWRVSIPDWLHKDANEHFIEHGKFVTTKRVFDGMMTSNTQAEIKYSLWNTNNEKH